MWQRHLNLGFHYDATKQQSMLGTHVHGSHVALANELTLSFLLIVVFPQKQSKEIGHNLRKSYPLLSLYNAG